MSPDYLRQRLLDLEGQSYKAYKELRGLYEFGRYSLAIDHVQGDPFASPSRLAVRVPLTVAGFPLDLWRSPSRNRALCDYLTRQLDRACYQQSKPMGTGNSGQFSACRTGQEILDRTAVQIFSDPDQTAAGSTLELRFFLGLPAQGRRALGRAAIALMYDRLPQIIEQSAYFANLDAAAIRQHVETAEDADSLRSQLVERGLVAFIADGSILPRRSGVDDRPLAQTAIAFRSPDSLRVSLSAPNRGEITGMGIPAGISLIVGGGYHGKSTLLEAIERGVYNHIPGDGREFVVTEASAMKIRAEDGRSVAGVWLEPFINHLPYGRSTHAFSTENASGSTSQAASIIEALEVGTRALLIDEDTSATNFTIRDRRMQALIAKDREPITPLIDRVRQLYDEHGVSTILVMGGSGDYFDVADTVIELTDYVPSDATDRARAIAAQFATGRQTEALEPFGTIPARRVQPHSIPTHPKAHGLDGKARSANAIEIAKELIDLSAISQIVDVAQARAIAHAIVFLRDHVLDRAVSDLTFAAMIDRVMTVIAEAGLDGISAFPQGDLAEFRAIDFAAALSRLRTLRVGRDADSARTRV
jgi:predicted ABC-class ATPase